MKDVQHTRSDKLFHLVRLGRFLNSTILSWYLQSHELTDSDFRGGNFVSVQFKPPLQKWRQHNEFIWNYIFAGFLFEMSAITRSQGTHQPVLFSTHRILCQLQEAQWKNFKLPCEGALFTLLFHIFSTVKPLRPVIDLLDFRRV